MSKNKVVTSAVVVVPPKESWGQIQAIRQQYDKSFDRWPPHINLLYPFVPQADFHDAAAKLKNHFATSPLPAFNVSFEGFRFFQHGKSSCTVWCDPKLKQGNELTTLQGQLHSVFPFCDDLSTRSADGFQPHLSVGQFSGKAEVDKKISEFMGGWKPIHFEVSEVFLIARRGDDPFVFKYKISLNGEIEQMDEIYESVPGRVSQSSGEATKDLFVANIPFTVQEETLAELFAKNGVKTVGVKIPKGPGGRSKGFGFVKIPATDDANKVIATMHGKVLEGRPISVKLAQ